MTTVQSKQALGKLTLTEGTDTVEVGCQAKSVTITPTDGGDAATFDLLCGNTLTEDGTADGGTLDLTGIQDFTNSTGFQAFAWKHHGKTVDFSWQPTDSTTQVFSGTLKVKRIPIGGEMNKRLEVTASWVIETLAVVPTGFGSGWGVVAITGLVAPTGTSKEYKFAPAGATLPANLTALQSNAVVGTTGTAKPTTAWSTGQFITLGDASTAHWSGTAWVAGAKS